MSNTDQTTSTIKLVELLCREGYKPDGLWEKSGKVYVHTEPIEGLAAPCVFTLGKKGEIQGVPVPILLGLSPENMQKI